MGDSNPVVALIILAIYALIWLAPLLIISKSSKTAFGAAEEAVRC